MVLALREYRSALKTVSERGDADTAVKIQLGLRALPKGFPEQSLAARLRHLLPWPYRPLPEHQRFAFSSRDVSRLRRARCSAITRRGLSNSSNKPFRPGPRSTTTPLNRPGYPQHVQAQRLIRSDCRLGRVRGWKQGVMLKSGIVILFQGYNCFDSPPSPTPDLT